MVIMSLRNRSGLKESMVLTRVLTIVMLFVHNYIRSLLNIIVRPISDGA